MENVIYFDNAATTQVLDDVAQAAVQMMCDTYYNPSSPYKSAMHVEHQMDACRQTIRDALQVQDGDVFFTAGGSESNNLAIQGFVRKHRNPTLITCATEHPSVLRTCQAYQDADDVSVVILPVQPDGTVAMDDVFRAVENAGHCLLSIMHVNNETGVVQDIQTLSKRAKQVNPDCIIHVDGVQAFCKINTSLGNTDVDMYSISAHKIHGPKGVGALYVNDNRMIQAVQHGGSQEKMFRPGTHNTPGIVAMGTAVRILQQDLTQHAYQMQQIKTSLWNLLNKELDNLIVCGGDLQSTAPHILNIAFENIKGEVLLTALDHDGLMVNTGSACSSKRTKVSAVLSAMQVPTKYIQGAIRLSFSRFTTDDEAQRAADIIIRNVKRLRRFT